MHHRLAALAEPIARMAALRKDVGRPGRVEVTFWGPVRSHQDMARYEAAGVDRVLARPWRSDEEPVEGVRRFAAELLGVPSAG
jgi:hypothetical protein